MADDGSSSAMYFIVAGRGNNSWNVQPSHWWGDKNCKVLTTSQLVQLIHSTNKFGITFHDWKTGKPFSFKESGVVDACDRIRD